MGVPAQRGRTRAGRSAPPGPADARLVDQRSSSSSVVGSTQWRSSELEHGPRAGEACQLVEEDLKGALLLPLRAEARGRIAPIERNAQQPGDQRHRLVEPRGRPSEQRLELPSFSGPRRRAQTCCVRQLSDDRWSALLLW